jgi:hypothetical protein
VLGLPEELRNVIEHRLVESGFHDYKALAEWIRQQGHEISPDSLRRFGARLAQGVETRGRDTAQQSPKARAFRRGSSATTEGLIRLAQDRLRSELQKINQLEQGDMSRLVHAVAHLTQAAISLQRRTDELHRRTTERERSAPQAKSLRAGLSPETSQRLRNALLGIAAFDPEETAAPQGAAGEAATGAPATPPVTTQSKKGDEAIRSGPAGPSKRRSDFDDGSDER